MKNLLIAIDFEEHFQQLIDKGIEIAEKFSSKIWLLHIVAPDPDFVGYGVGPQYIRDSKAEEMREEHRMLQDEAKRILDRGIEAEGLLIQGPTVETILEEAVKLKIDLIVIGRRDHGFFHKAIIGDTSSDVISGSDFSILVVPI